MNRRLLLSLFAAAGLATPLAAAPHWVPLGPYGGSVNTVVADPADLRVLYATSAFAGTFKSADAGATWTMIHAGSASSAVAVDPSRSTTIYQTLDFKQVLKSADGGATWTSSSRGLPNARVTTVAVDPAKRNRLFVASDGVWHSLDGGVSWQPSHRPLPKGIARVVLALAVASRPAGTLYAATGAGVFKSESAGDSWKPAGRGLPAGLVTTLAMAPSNPQILWAGSGKTVFRSTNGGASWSARAALPPAVATVVSLAVSPSNPGTVWVGTLGQGAYRTTDAGAHWTPAGPRDTARVEALAVVDDTLYAGIDSSFHDPGGVLASQDGGVSWQVRNLGLNALPSLSLAVDPHHPEILWTAAGLPGLYRSTVGGRAWEVPPQPPVSASSSLPGTNFVDFSADGAVLYTAINEELWASEGAGDTWRLLLGPGTAPAADVIALATAPQDASTIYAWGPSGLFASHDAGTHWQSLTPSFNCGLGALAIAPSAPATLYAGGAHGGPLGCHLSQAGLLRSTDGGANWTEVDSGLAGVLVASLAVDPFDPRTLYAQTGTRTPPLAGVWKSTDGGANWVRIGNATPTNLLFSLDGGTFWGSEGPQLLASHDGGASWQAVGAPAPVDLGRLVLDPIDPSRLYATTVGGVWVLEP